MAMQSILQYRRFRKHVTRQFERDKKKAEASRRGNAETGLSPSVAPTAKANPSPTSTDNTIDTRDPEKGELSHGHDLEHDPEKDELFPRFGLDHDPEKGELPRGLKLDHDPEKGELSPGLESEHDPEKNEQWNDNDPEKDLNSEFPPTAEEAIERDENQEDHPTISGRTTTVTTQHTIGTALGAALTGIYVRDRTTREGGDKGKVFVVGYEGERDNMNPHNWSFLLRLRATYVCALNS